MLKLETSLVDELRNIGHQGLHPPHGSTKAGADPSDGVVLRFVLDGSGRLVAASAIGQGNSVAKDIRLAEKLIEHRATPDPDALADSDVSLRSLLRQKSSSLN